MKMMGIVIWMVGLLGAFAVEEERGDASLELAQAKEAVQEGRYVDARKSLARIQVFYYREAEMMPEALYLEAWIDHQEGGARARVSALDELCALYPSSLWSTRAQAEFGVDAAAN